ncbi:uncharacterized protein LAJ45_09485 [Morchella importuna]|uniref:uncharacterized protein n=1 Tax=Morchella importuna TaxID=1174673 RepID=UPI001E8CBD57|nr:uncharacterized protein LAJ45_09485 [Morchella importuna]KAH8146539.1 hypothetical protein LAJ45_09485 [Morchella importuna]
MPTHYDDDPILTFNGHSCFQFPLFAQKGIEGLQRHNLKFYPWGRTSPGRRRSLREQEPEPKNTWVSSTTLGTRFIRAAAGTLDLTDLLKASRLGFFRLRELEGEDSKLEGWRWRCFYGL